MLLCLLGHRRNRRALRARGDVAGRETKDKANAAAAAHQRDAPPHA
ncbi:hypothetical protein PSAB6_250126 [Paraburkholderia sabiae]|nr:hypothetical protein PSAB6_250126 [Paraburkholderia sabiae]